MNPTPKSTLQLSLSLMIHDPTNHPQCNAKMTSHPPTQNASMNVILWASHDLQQEYGRKTLTIGICMLLNHKDNMSHMLFHILSLDTNLLHIMINKKCLMSNVNELG